MADVAYETVRLSSLHANLQTLLGYTHQLFLLRRGLADDEHTAGIGIIAVENRGEVDVDDIALLKYIFLLGDTVTDDLVDRGADGHGERRGIIVATIVQAGGDGVMLLAVLATYLVDLQRVHPCVDLSCHLVEYTRIDDTRPTDTLNLLRSLDEFAGRHFLALVLPIHDGLVHLRGLLARQTVPSSFLLKSIHKPHFLYLHILDMFVILGGVDLIGEIG